MKTNDLRIGFIGGGRITNIILRAWQRQHFEFASILIFDPKPEKSENLSSQYSGIKPAMSISELVQECHIIFLAIHPPVFSEVLSEVKDLITTEKCIVSLAPKISIAKIQQALDCKLPVVRIIPNAPSIIGKGYNVFSFSSEVNQEFSDILNNLFLPLGTFKQVEENLLESYATITGMGPTYIWYLFNELYQQALNTGLSDNEAKTALNEMIQGSSETLFHSDLTYEQVIDLIPSYPLKKHEENIQNIYAETISKLYDKLKN